MTGGFSFCGINIASVGLEYAPELEDTYVYKATKPRIHSETFDGHDGGYYYGISKEPKEFVLRCFFEEKEVDRGILAKVMNLFREGKSGKLVFDRRPWCYYYVVVEQLDLSDLKNYLNGVITVNMKAYYPYGRSDNMTVKPNDKDYYRELENTAFFEKPEMVPAMNICNPEQPIVEAVKESSPILLANPGTEYAHVGIKIAGNVGQGVRIKNLTTGQSCKFVAMNENEFDGINSYVYLDSINGKCFSVKDGVTKTNFLYHDEGFLNLAPAFPMLRNITVRTSDGLVITNTKMYDRNAGETREFAEEQLKGRYIWIKNMWHEITGVGTDFIDEDPRLQGNHNINNEHIIQIADDIGDDVTETTCICSLNRIIIEPVSTMKLTALSFIYKPTFA